MGGKARAARLTRREQLAARRFAARLRALEIARRRRRLLLIGWRQRAAYQGSAGKA